MKRVFTIRDILAVTGDYFAGKGIVSARLDAEILLANALNLRRLDLYLDHDRPLSESETASYRALVRRRAGREPVAYITGVKEFWSRPFIVRPGVIIPRPETELLVETVFDRIVKDEPAVGFEMGPGSGCVAVTLLSERPRATITAVEVSAEAGKVTQENTIRHGVTDRLTLVQGDFFAWVHCTDARYDFVVSNPPYVAEREWGSLAPEIRDHEPREALVAGDGLRFYGPLASFARDRLNPGGFIAVEIAETQGGKVAEIFRSAGLREVVIRKDLGGNDRVAAGKAP